MDKTAPVSRPMVNRPAGPGRAARPQRTAHEVVSSPEFQALVSKRWTVSLVLLVLLFVGYYGYILLIATNRELVSTRIGEVTTLAIPLGVGVIVFAWVLTAFYVSWANRSYDPEVGRMRSELRR